MSSKLATQFVITMRRYAGVFQRKIVPLCPTLTTGDRICAKYIHTHWSVIRTHCNSGNSGRV